MKMVECMEEEGPLRPKGQIGSEITHKQHIDPSSEGNDKNKHKWGQSKSRLHDDNEKLLAKEPTMKKAKWDLMKVKCFNSDNHEHLANDYLKPPQVNDYISQGNLILKGGFVVKIKVHENKASNLLKLKCKINNKLIYFLDL